MRDLDGAQPDRAEAEDGDTVAGAHAALEHGVVAGAHHVAGEQRHLVGDTFGHPAQREVGHRHERLVGLRALEVSEQLAVAEHPRAVALVVGAPQAEEARAAGGLEAAEHAIAHGDAGHVLTGGDDGADELVPDRKAGLDLHPPVVDVEIRATDAARLDADDGVIAGAQLGFGLLLDADELRALDRHGSHGASS